MNHVVRVMTVLLVAVIPARAQEPVPQPVPPPPVPTDSIQGMDTAATPVPVRLEPTADQQRYLRGMRTASRGVAQLKTGVDRVTRAESTRDSLQLRRAGRFLSGLCGTARSFMTQGRATMKPTVYEDTMRLKARRLTGQIDSLIKAMPACETEAPKDPRTAASLLTSKLKSYDTALQDFRGTTPDP
jgi:hypothetical protein